ncbi:hypothetical protein HNQ41_001746 [Texcoconibacillus texcoconensis]|uniref:Uncharacterized protein n=1 Tax=Texcoconibacillus texcoconensis TaxID=1095777 RepID=A0A840QQD0_9BACI|nr:hypothetical protein [Texcoconibacillus texcoconensis]
MMHNQDHELMGTVSLFIGTLFFLVGISLLLKAHLDKRDQPSNYL